MMQEVMDVGGSSQAKELQLDKLIIQAGEGQQVLSKVHQELSLLHSPMSQAPLLGGYPPRNERSSK